MRESGTRMRPGRRQVSPPSEEAVLSAAEPLLGRRGPLHVHPAVHPTACTVGGAVTCGGEIDEWH